MTESTTATDDTNAGESSVDEGVTGQSTEQPNAASEGAAATDTPGSEGQEGASAQPVTYADFDTSAFPEGYELNEQVHGSFKEIGQKHGIPQEAMQEFLNLGVQNEANLRQSVQDQHNALVEQWGEDVKKDPDLGGAKLEETLATSSKAIDTFATAEFKQFLNETGLGNHPEMVRFTTKVGQAISEDQLLTGNEPRQEKSTADKLYPSMNK